MDFENKIIHGDAMSIMRQIEQGGADIVVTSPPYNLRNSSGNGMKYPREGKWSKSKLAESGYNDHDDALPHADYVKWQRDCLSEMFRIIPENGAIFYNHKWRVQNGLLQDRADIVAGFPVRQVIIWHRRGGINFNPGYFLPTYEVIYLIAKPKFRLAKGANSHGDVWIIKQEMNNPHPAPFPLELAERIISSTTGKVVLDPFVGSGTTAIAATNCGRSFIGIEKSRIYCEMAQERIEKWNSQNRK